MNVLFVDMPFGAQRPAIGVSLLRARLDEAGAPSRVLYLNMRFARLVGHGDYKYVAEQAPSQSLAGDWVFSQCLFGERPSADEAYLEMFAERFRRSYASERAIGVLRKCRDLADGFLQGCLDDVDWGSYDIVGFTSTFTQHVASLALAERVKERFPDVLIAFGGANCEDDMGLQLHKSFPFVDLVCSGEADLTFPRLVETLAVGADARRIPGLVIRVEGRTECMSLTPERVRDLDTLPTPNYDDYFEQLAGLPELCRGSAGVLLESSRGCWWGEKHHCTFCGLNGTSMAFRRKSADRVLAEIEEQVQRYRPSHVEMVDNILDMRFFKDLLPELRRRRLKLGLFYETKANLRKDQVQLLSDAGVATIQPGIESFSTDILRLMRKGTSAAQNVQLLKWCKELGITAYWNLLYGFPGEDPADYETTARIIDAIHHLQPPQGVGAIRLDRFSPNFTAAEQLGIVNIRPDRSYQFIYDLEETELMNLAYYFEHDYVDGRDPETYIGDTYSAVIRWHEDSANRGLLYVDHGDMLGIWDFRDCAQRTLTILEDAERELYLYCDQHRSRSSVERFLSDQGESMEKTGPLLERLIDSSLMLKLDDRYLSLAVATHADTPPVHDQ